MAGLPTRQMVHPVDMILTNMSVGYMQDPRSHFARQIFPIVPVSDQSGKYQVFDKAAWLRDEAKRRAPGTLAADGGYTLSTGSYLCEEWAYRHKLPDEIRRNFQSPVSADLSAVKHVSEKLLIREDSQFASTFMGTGIWGTDFTGVSSSPSTNQFLQWDQSSSTPITDMRTGIRTVQKAIGRKPNVALIGPLVWDVLVDHSTVKSRIATSQTQIVTEQLIAALLGLDRVIVGESIYNSAAEGQTASMSHQLGKSVLLAYVTSAPSMDEPSAGYIFSWSEFDGVSAANAAAIRTYRQDDIKSDWYEGNSFFDMRVTASDAGYYLTSCIA